MASYSLMALIRDGSVHTSQAHHVLTIIGTYADPDGTGVSVSVPTLKRVTGLSERSIHYALRRLADSGELTIETGRGRGHTNTYAINRDKLKENLQRRRAEAGEHPTPPPENLQNLRVMQSFGPENLQTKPANGATGAGLDEENLQTASGKPANGDAAPTGVRTPVSGTPETELREPDFSPLYPPAAAGGASPAATVGERSSSKKVQPKAAGSVGNPRVQAVVDSLRGLGVPFTPDGWSAKEIKNSGYEPADIARAYAAAVEGAWTFRADVTMPNVIQRLPTFLRQEQDGGSRGATSGKGMPHNGRFFTDHG